MRLKDDLIVSRLIDERFPDYESVIPKNTTNHQKCNEIGLGFRLWANTLLGDNNLIQPLETLPDTGDCTFD